MVDSHYSLICLVFSAVDVLWRLIASDSILFKDWLFSVSTAYHILASIVAFNFAFFIFYFNKDNFKHLKLIAVRFGGDEFIVLLKNVTDTSLLENKAKQISDGIKILKEKE